MQLTWVEQVQASFNWVVKIGLHLFDSSRTCVLKKKQTSIDKKLFVVLETYDKLKENAKNNLDGNAIRNLLFLTLMFLDVKIHVWEQN